MRRIHQFFFVGFTWVSAFALAPAMSLATVVWNEASSTDLSNSGATPTAISVSAGTNSVIGSVGPGDQDDWITFTVPTGDQLSNLFLASYSSTDFQGFTGIFAGSSYSGSVNTAANYLGYSHYGTAAANGSNPPANFVGTDLLPLMGNNATQSLGSQGFTPPLPAGSYTVVIQQLGAATNYQFDYDITAAPEPASLCLLTLVVPALLRRRPN